MSSPGATTTSTPVTQEPVTPYLYACGPPACGRAHPRFDFDSPDERLERAHAVEPLQREHDTPVERHGAARIAGAAATRHDGNVVGVAPRDDLRDLLRRPRQRDGVRAAA